MNRKTRILVEITFFVVIFFAYQSEGFDVSLTDYLISIAFYLILYTHGLINRFLFLPLLVMQKRWGLYILTTIISLFVFAFIAHQSAFYCTKLSHPENIKYVTFYNSFASCVLSLFVMSSLEFIIQYFQREKEKADYKAIINQLESTNLKAQLNPHFLFNSLNNAYGISLAEPKRVPEYIMQLSQLMRYQLESTKQEFVSLHDEIEFVKNYLAIEKERIGNRCTITFTNTISVIALKEFKVIPMLFNTFIENAIKHGASGIEASCIDIHFSNINNEIIFSSKNSIAKVIVSGTQLGLKNVQQRLQIMYPNLHQLVICTQDNIYTINLNITLNKNV